MRTGKLEAYFETGTEGVIWSVYEDGKEGYEGLNCLQDGDYIKVFDPQEQVVFDGEVKLEWERNYRPYPRNPHLGQQEVGGFWVHGLQENIDPQTWSTWFHSAYRCEFWILERESLLVRVMPLTSRNLESALTQALDTVQNRMAHEEVPAILADMATHWKWDANSIHSSMADGVRLSIPTRVMERVRTISHAFQVTPTVFLEQMISRYIPTYDLTGNVNG